MGVGRIADMSAEETELARALAAQGYIASADAVGRFNVSHSTLQHWAKQKRVRSVRIGTRRYVVAADVEKAMEGLPQRKAVAEARLQGMRHVNGRNAEIEALKRIVREAVSEAFKERGL